MCLDHDNPSFGTYSKRSAIGDANWQICKNSKKTIGEWGPECKIVGYLMDREEKVLIRSGPNDVSCEKERQ